jgi:phenylacetate-CoA ligase
MPGNIWNPFLETLPLELLRKLQFKRFKNIFAHAYNHSPFYGKLYRKAGVTVDDIKTLDDIRRVPMVTKDDFRSAQWDKEPFPYGEMLAVPIEEVTSYHQTAGTTGIPTRFGDTWLDWETYAENYAMVMYSRGLRPKDRVYIPFPYHLFIAFWGMHYGAEKLGAEVVPGGQTSTEQRVREMKELRCTATVCTPTYALRMAEVARKIGIDPAKDIPVKMIFCAGEPGASIPDIKNRIEEAWNAKVYDHCGATEAPLWAFECDAQNGLHLNEPNILVEILNPDTLEPVSPGDTGTIVVTHLNRCAIPSVRFDLKDIARLSASPDPCPCGRTWRRIEGGVIGRREDVTNERPTPGPPSKLGQMVRNTPISGCKYEAEVMR